MTALETVHAIELRSITKRFGKVVANDAVDLTLDRGEILALLGENGSGKTTLMNMLSGIYFPDEGEILVEGKPVSIRSPKDAYDNGIGTSTLSWWTCLRRPRILSWVSTMGAGWTGVPSPPECVKSVTNMDLALIRTRRFTICQCLKSRR